MTHQCNSLLICCMDFRLRKALGAFLVNLPGDCDIISVAGAVKSLLSPENPSDRDFILKQIKISVELHGISEIILNNHTDCGAYGGSEKFNSFEEECEFQKEEMRKAKALILEKHPHLKVRMVLAKIQPSKEIVFEEIEEEETEEVKE